jgi:TPR repeat protein
MVMEEATCEDDFTDAFTWFFHAAEQGHCKAQYYLGTLYATGKGITKDYVKAYSWFSVAMPAESGDGGPRTGEPRAEDAMKKLKKNFTTDEISEAIEAGEELSGNLRDIEQKKQTGSAGIAAD